MIASENENKRVSVLILLFKIILAYRMLKRSWHVGESGADWD